MALSAAYAVCTTFICLEVVVILGLLSYLFKKPSDSGDHMKPDADKVATQLSGLNQEPEQPAEEPTYIIEYDNQEDPEPEVLEDDEIIDPDDLDRAVSQTSQEPHS